LAINENLHPWLENAATAGFVMLPKSLAHELGVEAAVLLSEILQRENYFNSRGMLTKDGFFFNTNKDMSSGTGLSERSLKRLYDILQKKGLIEIQLRGMPKRTHIRICYENKDFFEEVVEKGEHKLFEKESQVRVTQTTGGVIGKQIREKQQKKMGSSNDF